ncbi:MAG: response regulator transcription factor [Chloroflexi bacterium]|nr:response regulator transcription factor [Chloroflexota bacterium]
MRSSIGYSTTSAHDDLRVLVVAGDPLARAGLATLLANQPGCEVVGQIASDADLLNALDIYRPDVLVWDLGWEPSQALDVMSDLREDGLPPIVALLSDEAFASEAWSAGARGLLPRDAAPDTLTAALIAVAQGLVTLHPAMAAIPIPREQTPAPPSVELTPREHQVLRLMAEGLTNKSIAYNLDISDHTVKFHVNAILSKLSAQSRTEAVMQATRLGLIPL